MTWKRREKLTSTKLPDRIFQLYLNIEIDFAHSEYQETLLDMSPYNVHVHLFHVHMKLCELGLFCKLVINLESNFYFYFSAFYKISISMGAAGQSRNYN